MIDITARLQNRRRVARSSPAQTSSHFNHENEGAIGPLVLVVEDHAATQNVLFSVLDLQGYRVACVTNGQEALVWLEKACLAKQLPALILLDLFMPIMNGADFLASMRANWPSTQPVLPVILFTVDQGNHDDLACTHVLPKPFHIKDLLAKIKLVLNNEQMSSC